jgi:hypothetical protein
MPLEATDPAIIDGGPQCKHGFMTHKTGVGKTGKPYEGYVCPETDRNMQAGGRPGVQQARRGGVP